MGDDTNILEILQMMRPLELRLKLRLRLEFELYNILIAYCTQLENQNLINKMIGLLII